MKVLGESHFTLLWVADSPYPGRILRTDVNSRTSALRVVSPKSLALGDTEGTKTIAAV